MQAIPPNKLIKNEVLCETRSLLLHRIVDYLIFAAVCALVLGITGLDWEW